MKKLFIVLVLVGCVFSAAAAEIRGEVANVAGKRIDDALRQSWGAYKDKYIQKDGRVMDPSRGSITTSEGQSYGMLRAVWCSDRSTFDRVWEWTKNNLKREDRLFAWKWGQKCGSEWGVLETDAASDADEDIAYSLILASEKWKAPAYKEDAVKILADIWEKEVVTANGKPVMGPGPGAVAAGGKDGPVEINPSYFVPYEYRKFAEVDPAHDWKGLVDSSYELLNKLSDLSRLDLPPDWAVLDRKTGSVSIDKTSQRSDFSYDAIRIPWRIAADHLWYHDPRALAYLQKMSFLVDTWKITRTIRGAYSATGVMRSFDEPLTAFGCCLPMMGIIAPESAAEVMQERLMATYYNGIWRPEDDYYGNNWAWFGLALYSDAIPSP